MRILIVTPAKPGSRHGNRNTAMRWARLLRKSGHEASVVVDPAEADIASHGLMIALHARRSAAAVAQWKLDPGRPLVLALTGTDLYRDIRTDADARASLRLADRLVVLQAEGLKELVPDLRAKARVIHQSVRAVKRQEPPLTSVLITVIGHLRDEKDPLRAALALRQLGADSRVRVVQLGQAMSEEFAAQARRLMAIEPRYRWLGEVAHADAMRWLARSHAMVISSRMEGGAHVVSEAIACGVPVLASRIPGNVGLLGSGYRGYYPLEDERALAELMHSVGTDKRFELALTGDVIKRRHLVGEDTERDALDALVREVAAARR